MARAPRRSAHDAPSSCSARLRALRAASRAEDGLTLIEVVIAVTIMAIIMGPLAAAMVIGFNMVNASSQRLSLSADRQLVDVYLARDASSAQSATIGGTSPCTGAAVVLALQWNTVGVSGTPPTTTATAAEVDYRLQSGPSQQGVATQQLVRTVYTGSPCVQQSSQVVAYGLVGPSDAQGVAASASQNAAAGTMTLSLFDTTHHYYVTTVRERS
jgi:prepilin-type N-terminal cleavage/methylation domain-containing protein